jgi:pimeloyl-ACP methyl ester carboxylesterase
MRTLTLRVQGLTLSALALGSGPRVALLLHGFPDNARSMVPLMRGLAAAGWQAVAPFLRGYAPSDPAPDGDYTLWTAARDARAWLDHLDAEEALLVGHDWGAAVAYMTALRWPHRVSHCVGLSVPPPGRWRRLLLTSPAQVRASAYMARMAFEPGMAGRLAGPSPRGIEAVWRQWSPGLRPDPDRLADVARTFAAPWTPQAALSWYRCLLLPPPALLTPWRQTLRTFGQRIPVPTLVLSGREDRCMLPSSFHRAEEGCGVRCTVRLLDGAGHFLPLEAPSTVVDAVLTFVEAESGVR